MKRDISQKLLAWKSSSRRKPLLLQGARQTGKTFILQEFGRKEYETAIYCNFEEDPNLDLFFQRDLNPDRILAELSPYLNQEIQVDAQLISGWIYRDFRTGWVLSWPFPEFFFV